MAQPQPIHYSPLSPAYFLLRACLRVSASLHQSFFFPPPLNLSPTLRSPAVSHPPAPSLPRPAARQSASHSREPGTHDSLHLLSPAPSSRAGTATPFVPTRRFAARTRSPPGSNSPAASTPDRPPSPPSPSTYPIDAC